MLPYKINFKFVSYKMKLSLYRNKIKFKFVTYKIKFNFVHNKINLSL